MPVLLGPTNTVMGRNSTRPSAMGPKSETVSSRDFVFVAGDATMAGCFLFG